MAEIDKALPNVEQTINIPNPDEIQVEVEKTEKKPQAPVEVNQNDDGSVDINFDPTAMQPIQSGDHFANLAELLTALHKPIF